LNNGETSLSIDGLTAAELAFSKQERSAGRALGIPAKILLVPSLKVAAETLMKSLTVQVTAEKNKPEPTVNPHAGKYEVVSTPYLSSAAFTGNSATA
jgi:phage major head subunit gpT-like protein